MSNYYREQGYPGRKRVIRRLRVVAFVLLAAILVGIGFVAYDVYKSSIAANTPTESTRPITSTIVADSDIQTTPYFQLQTPAKWRAIANESHDGRYVYRQYNGPLVEQELAIDVNQPQEIVLALTQTTRVFPVSVTESGTLKLEGTVSDHCKKAVPKGTERTQQFVKMSQVTFACNPDGTNYIVVVGAIGGTETLTLKRPDGTKAAYRITYRNVTAQPSARDLDNIIRTFETR